MVNFTFLLICSILYQYTSQESVNVSLYYESLCPYCIDFVSRQLYPGYQKIGESLVIDLIPYGKAKKTKIDGKCSFQCQHGPNECYGNKMQACVLKHHPDIDTQMNFIGCMMSSSDPASSTIGEQCAIEGNLSWDTIEKCSKGSEGDELLDYYGTKTQALGTPLHVPYLLFNNVYNATLEAKARGDFVKAICELLEIKPKGCFV